MIQFCLNQNTKHFQFKIYPTSLALPAQAGSVVWELVIMKKDVDNYFIFHPPFTSCDWLFGCEFLCVALAYCN